MHDVRHERPGSRRGARSFRPRLAGLGAAVAALVAALPAAAEAPVPLSLPAGQSADVARLGGGPVDLATLPFDPAEVGRRARSEPIPFLVPAGQGNRKPRGRDPEVQYVFRLDVVLRVPADSEPGTFYVNGMINGSSGPAIGVTVKREGDRSVAEWGFFSLVEGVVVRPFPLGRDVRISTSNFMAWNRVRPGRNQVSFELERYGKVVPERAEVEASSEIEATREQPARLELKPSLTERVPVVGERLRIPFRLLNSGDYPALNAVVRVRSQNSRARVLGAERRRFGALRGTRRGVFTVEPVRPGRIAIQLLAAGANTNLYEVRMEGTAVPP